MNATSDRAARRMSRAARARLVEDLERLTADAGISRAALARAAWRVAIVRDPHPRRDGAAIARDVGSARDGARRGPEHTLHPNTGPAIRDRHQARIVEALLRCLHPRWRPFAEVAVRRPAHGWVDVILHEPRENVLVAAEIESTLNRVEQLIRWSSEKAASLPSWDGWKLVGEAPEVSRLLVVRRTRATRDAAAVARSELLLAYPAHPADALAALTGAARWTGPAMVWARIDPSGVRFLHGR